MRTGRHMEKEVKYDISVLHTGQYIFCYDLILLFFSSENVVLLLMSDTLKHRVKIFELILQHKTTLCCNQFRITLPLN